MKDKILYIDDEQANLDGFYYSFEDKYNIELALSAYDAIKIIKNQKFKVIISDQRMDGLTGIEFFTKHKNDFNNAILIILTAYSDSEDIIKAINDAGIYRYIMKPWDPNDLQITIDSAIDTYDLREKNKSLVSELELKNERLAIALEQAKESDELKTSFLNNISHEIRTPMNGIMGFVELVKSNNYKPENIDVYIDTIHKSSERLLRIIEDILEFTLITNDDLRFITHTFRINRMLDELFKNFIAHTSDNLCLSLTKLPKDIQISTDEQKIRKILRKLIENAYKYCEKGEINFGCINDSTKPNRIKFFVTDTGKGISKKISPKIFNPFSKETYEDGELNEGTGLSLAISKKIIEKLGGEIWFESEVKKGTSFYFTLPIN